MLPSQVFLNPAPDATAELMDAQGCHELPKCSFSFSCCDRIPREGPACGRTGVEHWPLLAASWLPQAPGKGGPCWRQLWENTRDCQGQWQLDLPTNLLLLHNVLLTSDCLLTRCWQAGSSEQECLQARARCGADVLGPVWSSLHVALAGLWLLRVFRPPFLGCD